jgi:hypothetical protein
MPVKTPIPYFPASLIEKTVLIKLNRPVENNLSTPVALPTSEPEDGQLKITLQASDFPQLIPENCLATYIGIFSIVCKFITAGTLYGRIYKNGGLVASASVSVSANYFCHFQGFVFGVDPGDEINFKVWSSVTDSSYDFTAYQIQPTRVAPPEAINTPISINYGGLVIDPTYSGSNRPTGSNPNNYYVYFLDYLTENFSTSKEYPIFQVGETYKLFRLGYGDYTGQNYIYTYTYSSRSLTVQRNYIPTTIRLKIWKLY